MKHDELVQQLAKPGKDIKNEMTGATAHAMHMTLGIAGEAGEIVDCIKKWAIYGKTLDIDNLIEELGDLEFYLEGLRQAFGISREHVLEHNIEKLTRRYANLNYSNESAIARADKA
jgi:NTP pyrophosphatase (non-canonical NTP hydrolase)